MDRTTKAIVLLCVHVCLVHGYTTPTKELNMESSDCDHAGDYTVTDLDIVKVWANPPFQNAGSGSRDRCVIRLRAELGNRRLFVYVTDVLFNDRGIQLKVYDSTSSAHPRHVLTSDDGPGMRWELKTSVMFELVKQSTSARTYKFSIMVTTDQGPNIDFEQNVNEYYGQTLTIGAIVGLAIGGGLIFLALVGIAIYCIIKHRRKRLSKEREAGSTNAGSTVYSSTASQVLFPSHPDRYAQNKDADSRNSSMSSNEGQNNYVYPNPAFEGKQTNRGRRRNPDAHDGKGVFNEGFETSEYDSSDSQTSGGGHKYSKYQPTTGSISRERSGSARSRSLDRKRKASETSRDGNDPRGKPARRRPRSSNGGHHHGSESPRSRSSRHSGGSGGSHSRRHGSHRSRSPGSSRSSERRRPTVDPDAMGSSGVYRFYKKGYEESRTSDDSTSSSRSASKRVSYDLSGLPGREKELQSQV
ncbi:filaggrin-like isoform X2 [Gigantopelta aegis]|uniref:filaggrin-like isoform X2 n=1 Tax=Gigantopelta aegis TaxID=1735272 RepID=UPI001B88C173|nr:filaggrin-like isoform X2 [Gigantopelta aegis]